MEYLGAWGTLIHEKNLKSKISCQTPCNISFHSTINRMTKFPSKSGAGPAEDDQYSRPEAEGQGPPGRPWTLWCRVAWTNERTGRRHVTEMDPPITRPPLDSLMSSSMDQWENRSQSRDWPGISYVEYDMDPWENRPQPRDWPGITKTPGRPWTLLCRVWHGPMREQAAATWLSWIHHAPGHPWTLCCRV